jgi:hypothetical protein
LVIDLYANCAGDAHGSAKVVTDTPIFVNGRLANNGPTLAAGTPIFVNGHGPFPSIIALANNAVAAQVMVKAPAKKKAKHSSSEAKAKAPPKKKAKHASKEPGWCSHPDRQLTRAEVNEAALKPDSALHEQSLFPQKRRTGEDYRQLAKVGDVLFEFAGDHGKKIMKKEKERFLQNLAAAKALKGNENCTAVLVLGNDQHMCTRITLPDLMAQGVVVQRWLDESTTNTPGYEWVPSSVAGDVDNNGALVEKFGIQEPLPFTVQSELIAAAPPIVLVGPIGGTGIPYCSDAKQLWRSPSPSNKRGAASQITEDDNRKVSSQFAGGDGSPSTEGHTDNGDGDGSPSMEGHAAGDFAAEGEAASRNSAKAAAQKGGAAPDLLFAGERPAVAAGGGGYQQHRYNINGTDWSRLSDWEL